MKFFAKKETIVSNIAFMAVFAGVDAVFSLFGALLPAGAVLLSLFAPLCSALVAYYCKMRYYPLYAVAAFFVSLGASFFSLQTTLYYLLPALALGAVYGGLAKLRAPSPLILFAGAISELAFFYLSALLIQGLYGISMETVLLTLANLQDRDSAHAIFPLFILGYSFAQMGLVEVVFALNAERIGIPRSEEKKLLLLEPVFCLALFAMAFGTVFWLPWLGYLLLGLSAYWGVYSAASFLRGRHFASWIILGVSLFLSLLLFGLFFRSFEGYRGMILLGLFPLSLSISSFANTLLIEKKRT